MTEPANHDHAKLIELVKDMHIAMMTTRGTDGKLRSRPMAVSDVAFDGNLYFLTGEGSGKVHDLEKDSEIVVTFANTDDSTYVAVRGTGSISQDRAAIKAHWSEAARGWFPKGAEDPNIALITVKIDEAEYWDTPSGRMVMAFSYAKAMLTGKPAGKVGEHGKVSL